MMKKALYYSALLIIAASSSMVDGGFIRGTTLLDPKSIEMKEPDKTGGAAAAQMNNGKEENEAFRQLRRNDENNVAEQNIQSISLTDDANDEQRQSPMQISSNQIIMDAAGFREPIHINHPIYDRMQNNENNEINNVESPLDTITAQEAPPVGQQQQEVTGQVQQQPEQPKVQVIQNAQPQEVPSPEKIDGITQLGKKNPRKFIKYESSEWEKIWLNKIKFYEAQGMICEALETDHHMSYMHEFLNKMCTNRLAPPNDHWCFMFDHAIELWYNTANTTHYDIHWSKPPSILQVELQNYEPYVVHHHTDGDNAGRVLSKYTFENENNGVIYEEYIEPLVSHLRFPLSKCLKDPLATPEQSINGEFFRGWIVPPPPTIKQQKNHKFLFDVGSTEWSQGYDASLHYFTSKWSIQSIHFDSFNIFGIGTPAEQFMATVPEYLREYVHYQQCPAIASTLEDHSSETPFVPILIQQLTKDNDYVALKLDNAENPQNEINTIDYILNENVHVDELFWEHHISGNYLMKEDWGNDVEMVTLEQSYNKFLELRNRGIRAHSWV